MANTEMKPIVFCNIGWNNYYIDDPNDPLIGGGSYVRENGTGNEKCNFLPIAVTRADSEEESIMLLGSFETKHNRGNSNQTHIERIRGCKALRKEEYAGNVIVVWCAKNPDGKTCVVGWYKNASVCRFYDVIPIDADDGNEWERCFNVSALYEDAVLLPIKERNQPHWEVPRHNQKAPVPFGFGQANIWYAAESNAEEFVKRMIHQIENYSGEDIKIDFA